MREDADNRRVGAVHQDIQAVTFDVGGTLIRPWPSVGHVYGEVAARHGYGDVKPAFLNQQFSAAWRAKRNFDHSRPAWLELVKQAFAGSLDEAAVREVFDDIYERFAAPAAWQMFDDVRPTLEMLRDRGMKLGVVSNWDERLRPLLRGLGLIEFFEPIVVSVEVGFAKPSRQIFDRAVSLLGMPAEAIIHVGDSVAEDITGATAAGLQAVLIDRVTNLNQPSSIRTTADLIDFCIANFPPML